MLLLIKAPIIVQNQDTSGGGVGEFRPALESKFIDCNALGLSHRGKL